MVTVYVSLRRNVRRTLYDFYCPYFLPDVMVKFIRKARGHFVLLIQAGMRLIECISGLIPQEGVTSTCLFTLTEKQRRRCTFTCGGLI